MNLHEQVNTELVRLGVKREYDTQRGVIKSLRGGEYTVEYNDNLWTSDIHLLRKKIRVTARGEPEDQALGRRAKALLHEIAHADLFPVTYGLILAGMACVGKHIEKKHTNDDGRINRRDFLKAGAKALGAFLGLHYVGSDIVVETVNSTRYPSGTTRFN